jgi:hypothetical protein
MLPTTMTCSDWLAVNAPTSTIGVIYQSTTIVRGYCPFGSSMNSTPQRKAVLWVISVAVGRSLMVTFSMASPTRLTEAPVSTLIVHVER